MEHIYVRSEDVGKVTVRLGLAARDHNLLGAERLRDSKVPRESAVSFSISERNFHVERIEIEKT